MRYARDASIPTTLGCGNFFLCESREKMEVPIVAGLLAPVVLASYLTLPRENYLTHSLWFGTPRKLVHVLVAMQIPAAIGLIVALVSWTVDPPQHGILASVMLPVVLAMFLIASAGWAVFVQRSVPLTILCLVIVAAASLTLLVGSISGPWHVTCALIFLCATTVVADAVLWTSYYVKK